VNPPSGRWLFRLVSFLLLVGFTYFLVSYRQDIVDRWQLFNYKPSSDVVALADSAALDGRGRDLFFVSDPKIEGGAEFNASCTDTGEQSIVLGCYSLQKIYIFNVTDTRLAGVKEVTAAHEMLHAAYERLSADERAKVDKMVKTQMGTIHDAHLNELTDLYNKEEPGELLNEMHSIIGTEYGSLNPDLENYYKQYFSNRAKLVAFSNDYAATFTDSQKRIATYEAQLADLKSQIDKNTAELSTMQAALAAKSAQLDTLRTSNSSEYNSEVPGYNADARAYNNLASRTSTLIGQYNAIVEKRNGEAAAQNDLYHSLDSTYHAVGTD
jgi:hypothetical protein